MSVFRFLVQWEFYFANIFYTQPKIETNCKNSNFYVKNKLTASPTDPPNFVELRGGDTFGIVWYIQSETVYLS